jgi:BirA family biotin operon repressor/biotin-[acetyl-CoA-carboxylase] ligase
VKLTSFDAAAIRAALPASLDARLEAIEVLSELDSTNAEALRRSAALPDLALILADAQSAGRGRRGRVWQSPPGANLYASLHWRHRLPPNALAGLSLVVGLACAEALHELGATEVRVKWPNDLLARGRKLGGVLIELAPDVAVIGIGLNLHMPETAAAQIDQPWIDLAMLDVALERHALAARLMTTLLPALELFNSHGLSAFSARWIAFDALAGAQIMASAGDQRLQGEALGLAPDGGLRVLVDGSERVLHSAEVTIRPA